MKALTISQPFASLIADGEKWVENRRWPTSHRGDLAIHAGKGSQYLGRDELAQFPTGCVIAIANLVACVPLQPLREGRGSVVLDRCGISVESLLSHQHAEGPFCWVLRNVRRIEPVYVRGLQGLWLWEANVVTH